MAIDAKYGLIDIPGVPDDMPCFILLAKDKHAVPTLARYRNFMATIEEGTDHQPTPEYMEALDAEVARFAEWRTENPDQMKVAD
jgi:hypothetical protein